MTAQISVLNLLGVVAVAFLAPLLARALGRFRVPAVVLELVAGIMLGPAVLGWIEVDQTVAVLALLGLAALLFLAGLELDPSQLRGPTMRVALRAFALSMALALVCGFVLHGVGLTRSPVFIAIAIAATSLGVVVPVLKDAGLERAPVGQLVVLGASIADIATIVLLSLLFSEQSGSIATQALLVGGIVALAIAFVLLARGTTGMTRISRSLQALQDTTAQIRVRGAMLLLVGFVAAADLLGVEVILGAFIAGAVLTVADPDREMTHPGLRTKLEAIGYGLLIPVFFVTSGLRFDLDALTQDASTIALVPAFLLALLVARALPALAYRAQLRSGRLVAAAGLLQATSLPFLVATAMIGVDLGLMQRSAASALIAAGLLSVLLFPSLALALLAGGTASREDVNPGLRQRAKPDRMSDADAGVDVEAGPAPGPSPG